MRTGEQAKAYLEHERLWEHLLAELRQEKTVTWLVAHAKIT